MRFGGVVDTITDFETRIDTIDVVGISDVAMRMMFGPVINSADRGVGFVNVPGDARGVFDEGGMLVIDFRQHVGGGEIGVLTVQGVHELAVGTEIL